MYKTQNPRQINDGGVVSNLKKRTYFFNRFFKSLNGLRTGFDVFGSVTSFPFLSVSISLDIFSPMILMTILPNILKNCPKISTTEYYGDDVGILRMAISYPIYKTNKTNDAHQFDAMNDAIVSMISMMIFFGYYMVVYLV